MTYINTLKLYILLDRYLPYELIQPCILLTYSYDLKM